MWSNWHKLRSKFIYFYRHQETNTQSKKKNQLCKQLKWGGLFYWFQFILLHLRWVEMSCYRFPKYSLKVLFVFIVSYTNAKCIHKSAIFIEFFFSLMYFDNDAVEKSREKKSTNKNNASRMVHTDAFSMGLFSLCIPTI